MCASTEGVVASMDYPVIIKAVAGGGGRRSRVVRSPREFAAGFRAAASEAIASCGDGTLHQEHHVERPPQVDGETLGTAAGAIAQSDRDCSA